MRGYPARGRKYHVRATSALPVCHRGGDGERREAGAGSEQVSDYFPTINRLNSCGVYARKSGGKRLLIYFDGSRPT